MSFDVYLVPTPSDGDWDAAMDRRETAAADSGSLGPDELATWGEIRAALLRRLPDLEDFGSDDACELTEPSIGLQVFMYPGELGFSVPYWYDGDVADRIVGLLRDVAADLERITGLAAYDPQSGGAFLRDDVDHTAAFDQVAHAMAGHLGGTPSPPPEPPRPWWKFWG